MDAYIWIVDSKERFLQQLNCAVCHDVVRDARICPQCSLFYCNNCIGKWLKKSNTCPGCRSEIRYDTLVVGRSINAMQESFTELIKSIDENLCIRHKQHLIAFCYSCNVNICARFWFSLDHVEHKEQTVSFATAYYHFKKTLPSDLVWVNGRKQLNYEAQAQVAQIQHQLKTEREQIEQIDELCNESAELFDRGASSAALTKIANVLRTITELRSQCQRNIKALRIDRCGDFMQEPIVLVFDMAGVNNMLKLLTVESVYKDANGFIWKCKLIEEFKVEGDLVVYDADTHESICYLTLVEGKCSEYCVSYDNQPERVFDFQLNEEVRLGIFKPSVKNNNCRITVEVRQTYADKIQQLQERIAQLELQCAEQKSFQSFLVDYGKSMGHISG